MTHWTQPNELSRPPLVGTTPPTISPISLRIINLNNLYVLFLSPFVIFSLYDARK